MKKIINSYLNETMSGISTSKATIVNGLIIGAFVGLSIALYDWIVTDLIIKQLKMVPLIYVGLLPLVGMILTGLIINYFHIKRTSLADDVVHAYHTKANNLEVKESIPKLLASITTMGFGGSAGLEGSSKWVGAIVGLITQKIINFIKPLARFKGDLTIAMMTGASAGIGAIFKAPLSGTIMALESPYKKDLAHEPLVQSFLGAVTSYAIFTAIRGSQKFFIINLEYTLRWEDIVICGLIGLVTGIFSSIFLKLLVNIRENFSRKFKILTKYLVGGIILSLIAYIGLYIFNHYVSLYGGNEIIINIFNNKYNTSDSVLIAVLKSLATITTFAFGGVGGLFLPSATIGACIGQIFQVLFHFTTPGILPFIGVASFIAASYNGLLFGPVLIAEISGEPSLVVLGIVASTISYLVSNGVSNSSHQIDHREEHHDENEK